MSEVQKPSCGRIVHFFHNDADVGHHCAANSADRVPAIVVQAWGGLVANLSVFPMNQDGTNVLRYSVNHKSEAPQDASGNPTGTYWDWPERG